MNKDTLAQLRQWLRSPYLLMGVIIAAGFAVLMLLIVQLLIPAAQASGAVESRIRGLQQQKQLLDSRPVPRRASEQDIAALVRQVPLKDELARFLLDLKDVEQAAGARIESYSYGSDNASASDPLAPFRTTPGAASGGAAASSAPAGGSGATGAAQTGGPVAPTLEALPVNLQISGSYAAGIDFLSRLARLDRYVQIKDWSMQSGAGAVAAGGGTAVTAGGAPGASSAPESAGPRDTVSFSLKLRLYKAPGYAGKFKDLPPLAASEVTERLDPTWSEAQFRALLQMMQLERQP